MREDKYILNPDHTARPCGNLLEWAMWFETAERRVARDEFDGFTVSTVFLGLDRSAGMGRPVLFETMIFTETDHELAGYAHRYSTWEEAEAGHARAVEMARAAGSAAFVWPEYV